MALGDKKAISNDCARCMLRRERGKPLADSVKELEAMQTIQAVHHLSFDDCEELRRHLTSVMGGDQIRVEPHIKFWMFVHRYHGQTARDKFIPIALVWFEANGRTVHRRGDWVMNYRRKHPLILPEPRQPDGDDMIENRPF